MSVVVRDDRRLYDLLASNLRKLGRTRVTVGVHDSAGQHDGSSETVAQIAATHEFGAGRIPERSFLRKTFDDKEGAIYGLASDAIDEMIAGRLEAEGVGEKLGLEVTGMVKRTIQDGIDPPLSPQTIAIRDAKAKHGGGLLSHAGAHTPLIDSGQLISSITHEVAQ